MQLFESLKLKGESVSEADGSVSVTGVSEEVGAEQGNKIGASASTIGFVISPNVRLNFRVPAVGGETLYELMMKAVQAGNMTFQTKMYPGIGRYLISIDGWMADSSKKQYWEIEANGKPITLGIDLYKPSEGEEIEFLLTTWS